MKFFTSRFIFFLFSSFITLTSYTNCGSPIHTSGDSNSSNSYDEASFKCTDSNQSSSSSSYLLTKVQYQNTIADLFGVPTLSAVQNDISTLFDDVYDVDTYARTSQLSSTQMEGYYNTARSIAANVVGNNSLLQNVFGSCATGTNPNSTCIDTYLNGFASKIFRRPLDNSEITFAKTLMSVSGSYKENLKALLAFHLISPSFLWRLELGNPQPTNSGKIVLTPYELAARISYLITDSTPDNTLFSTAQDGSLLIPTIFQQQVSRLLQTTRGKTKLIDALLKWSGNDSASSLSGLPPELINGLNMTNLESAMVTEARTFVDYIVFQKNGSFKDLLMSKESFATHTGLAQIYGHAPVTNLSSPALFGDNRHGLLMRAPAMTWSVPRTNIIQRGVAFQKRILCNSIPVPNVDIASNRNQHVLTADELLQVTNRSSITYQTDSPLCMSCHSMINPAGFALESFDSLGQLRSTEKVFDTRYNNLYVRDLPLHTTASIPISNNITIDATDASDLIDNLVTSDRATACFSRKMYRIAFEKKESTLDDCQLADMQKNVIDPNSNILEAMTTLFTNQHLFYKE